MDESSVSYDSEATSKCTGQTNTDPHERSDLLEELDEEDELLLLTLEEELEEELEEKLDEEL
jgi:hypothetical protein